MKKIYKSPHAQVVRINTSCPILAGSPVLKDSGYNPSGESLAPELDWFED
jgi:hypothetical protein